MTIVLCAGTAPASAAWAGPDPSSNIMRSRLPMECGTDPTGTICTDTAVSILNQARATMGEPAYVLPADFDSLSPIQQLFILTNDDRTLYGLPAVPGLTGQLNQDAAAGILTDSDPWPSAGSWMAYTSNWAGGFANAALAYDAWMYADGLDSGNLDCTDTDPSGCWGHRHDVLWKFEGDGPVAMGAAVGTDPGGMRSYTMLLVQGNQGYQPNYTYTWAQAVADGAGGPGAAVGGSGSGSGSAGSDGSGSGSGSGGSDGTGSDTGSTGSGSDSGSTGSGSTGTGSTGSGSGSDSGSGSGTGSTGSGSGSGPGSGNGSGSGGSDGAGSGSGSSGSGSGGHAEPPSAHGARVTMSINRLQVFGHRIWFQVADPSGLNLRCALRHWKRGRWRTQRSKRCATQALFQHVPHGHYRLRISSAAGAVSRRVVVH
jgi:hypothetical protein